MAEKLPPQNIEAEQSVLGGILLENEALNEIVDTLRSDDFYRRSHQIIFDALTHLSDKSEPADLITLTEYLKSKNNLESIGGSVYLATLVSGVPTASNIKAYAKIVKEKSILRHLIKVASDITSRGYEDSADVEEFLYYAEASLFEVTDAQQKSGVIPIKELIKGSFKKIEELHQRKSPITGVRSEE